MNFKKILNESKVEEFKLPAKKDLLKEVYDYLKDNFSCYWSKFVDGEKAIFGNISDVCILYAKFIENQYFLELKKDNRISAEKYQGNSLEEFIEDLNNFIDSIGLD